MADVYDQPDELTQDTLALHVDKLNEDAVRVKWILDGKLESWIYKNDD